MCPERESNPEPTTLEEAFYFSEVQFSTIRTETQLKQYPTETQLHFSTPPGTETQLRFSSAKATDVTTQL